MKHIKFLFMGVITLAALLFLVAPPLTGLWVKRLYTEAVTHFNTANPNWSINVTQYKLGWFRSNIVAQIKSRWDITSTTLKTAALPSGQSATSPLTAYINVRHGPLLWVKTPGNTHTVFALAKALSKIPALNATGKAVWTFNRTVHLQLASPDFRLRTQDNQQLLAKQLRITAHLDLKVHRIQWEATLAAAQLHKVTAVGEIRSIMGLEGLKIEKNTHAVGTERIQYGQQRLSVDHLTLTFDDPNNNQQTISQLDIHTAAALDKDKAHGQLKIAIGKISPSLWGMNGLDLTLDLQNLNAAALNEMATTLEQQGNQDFQYYAVVIPIMHIIQKGFDIKVTHLALPTDAGLAQLTGDLHIPGTTSALDLLQLRNLIDANFHLQIPKLWLQQLLTLRMQFWPQAGNQNAQQAQPLSPTALAQLFLKQLESQKILLPSGDHYIAHIQYQKGKFLLNDQVELPSLPLAPSPPTTTTPTPSSPASVTPTLPAATPTQEASTHKNENSATSTTPPSPVAPPNPNQP